MNRTDLEATTTTMPSPVGVLAISTDATARSITRVTFLGEQPAMSSSDAGRSEDLLPDVLLEARGQLEAYFAGDLATFDLPIAPRGSSFQQRVWAELTQIPFGSTISYGQLAARLGLPPGGSRAVGLANGANPIAIVVPCHRVIGADGRLTGYAGGIERKRYLLDLESRRAIQPVLFAP